MRNKTIALGSAAVLLAVSALVSSSASATPTSVPAPAPIAIKDLPADDPIKDPAVFVSNLPGSLKAKASGIEFKTKGTVVVRNFVLNYPANSYSGWHQHPGIVMASVLSGSVTRTLPCQAPETFTVGDAFVEVGAHYVASSGGAKLAITQIAPAGTTGPAFREDLPEPSC
jgi:hypothetical protein